MFYEDYFFNILIRLLSFCQINLLTADIDLFVFRKFMEISKI